MNNYDLIHDFALLDAIRDRILIELYLALEDLVERQEKESEKDYPEFT